MLVRMAINRHCHKCGLEYTLAGSPGRSESCLCGADRIELYTGPYAEAFAAGKPKSQLQAFADTARAAAAQGLGINAGHDLSEANLGRFLHEVPGVLEVSIGHALVSEALYSGLDATVKRYLAVIAGR